MILSGASRLSRPISRMYSTFLVFWFEYLTCFTVSQGALHMNHSVSKSDTTPIMVVIPGLTSDSSSPVSCLSTFLILFVMVLPRCFPVILFLASEYIWADYHFIGIRILFLVVGEFHSRMRSSLISLLMLEF